MTPIYVHAGGDTERASYWAHKLVKPDEITQVRITRRTLEEGGHADVAFILKNNTRVSIQEGFSVGYRGEGPTALYTVLKDLGFSDEKANQVFTFRGTELTFQRK